MAAESFKMINGFIISALRRNGMNISVLHAILNAKLPKKLEAIFFRRVFCVFVVKETVFYSVVKLYWLLFLKLMKILFKLKSG